MNENQDNNLKCPECGGESGYYFTEQRRNFRGWDGKAQAINGTATSGHAKCQDCGQTISWTYLANLKAKTARVET